MLSINSTIHEIEQAHKSMNMKLIAREAGIGEAKLKQVLTSIGYEYDTAKRKWRYILMDESKDIRNRSLWSIMEQLENGNTNITDTEACATDMEHVESKQDVITDGNKGNIEFTQDEIIVLKRMAQRQMATGTSGNVSDGSTAILEAIEQVADGSTSKKTFVIQDEVVAQLDAFCDLHRIKKSDFLTVAIQEALGKYG